MLTKFERAQRLADNLSMESTVKPLLRRFGTNRVITTNKDQAEGLYSSRVDIAPEMTRFGLKLLTLTADISSIFGNRVYRNWLELNRKAQSGSNEITIFESGFK